MPKTDVNKWCRIPYIGVIIQNRISYMGVIIQNRIPFIGVIIQNHIPNIGVTIQNSCLANYSIKIFVLLPMNLDTLFS